MCLFHIEKGVILGDDLEIWFSVLQFIDITLEHKITDNPIYQWLSISITIEKWLLYFCGIIYFYLLYVCIFSMITFETSSPFIKDISMQSWKYFKIENISMLTKRFYRFNRLWICIGELLFFIFKLWLVPH